MNQSEGSFDFLDLHPTFCLNDKFNSMKPILVLKIKNLLLPSLPFHDQVSNPKFSELDFSLTRWTVVKNYSMESESLK